MSEIKYDVENDRYTDEDGNVVVPADLRKGSFTVGDVARAKDDAVFKAAVAGLSPPGNVPVAELVYKVWNPVWNQYEKSPTPQPMVHYTQAANDMIKEIVRARKQHGPMASAHEGYAVMLEEMDEFKDHVWMKQKNRDHVAMRKELIQLGAMVIAMIVEVVEADNRR